MSNPTEVDKVVSRIDMTVFLALIYICVSGLTFLKLYIEGIVI